ncbi:hypothetical protein AB2B41_06930 [Marimonas sp. MJW-29]|uniref:Uncharacterized protein n=1 Tax=Sulfitobacter sediminis TaxID=3234186 RepID=A0ABV3RK22_9RHOB
MSDPATENTAILIGANSFVDAAEALRLIGRVAQEWRPRLGGLLIEDAETTALCCMPNQRVVTTSGTLAVAPTLAQIKTMMEADARAFRSALARIAEGTGTPWSFEQEMGDLIQKGLQMALSWDILVLAHRNINAITGKVVILEPAGRPSPRAATLADTLARHLVAERVVVSMPQTGAAETSRAQVMAEILKRLGQINAQAVVLDVADTGIADAEDLRRLTDAARCPVFVTGLAATQRSLAHSTQIPPAPDATRDS